MYFGKEDVVIISAILIFVAFVILMDCLPTTENENTTLPSNETVRTEDTEEVDILPAVMSSPVFSRGPGLHTFLR